MGLGSRLRLVGRDGNPLREHIAKALRSLVHRFQREFPLFRDESALTDALEEAGRKVVDREEQVGPLNNVHAYAWVALRNIGRSRTRSGSGRIDEGMLGSTKGRAIINGTLARFGTAEDIERQILVKEVLSQLTPEERRVCLWKKAGFTSPEIAERLATTAGAIDTLFSRTRQKVRRLLDPQPAQQSSAEPDTAGRTGSSDDTEVPDGK